ncbi:hypothetical protein POV27_05130 [Aureisphaera galaxeae]|uniref:hypothetical protein n=1 Tax=Aureisphaera galaxeae TaxID=1538023 RepID=UPI00234FE98B|nr:hypothetical protein [Aureisphaera galaxeae]MDC8003422.1 hypothetical protein [Aureisphaera galaxeae]
MKTITKFLLICAVVLAGVSCSNDDDGKSTTLIFTPLAEVDNSSTLIYDLGVFGDPELTTIIFQAENARISELRQNEETGDIEYVYLAEEGFIGTDRVHIQTETGPLGSPESSPVMIAQITIKVSE